MHKRFNNSLHFDSFYTDFIRNRINDSSDKQIDANAGAIDSQFWDFLKKKSDGHGADVEGNSVSISYDENNTYREKDGIAVGEGEDFCFTAPRLIQEDVDDSDRVDGSTLKMEFCFSDGG